jgi:hypothetical protein
VEWADKQALTRTAYKRQKTDNIEQYFIKTIDSIDFEGDKIADPIVEPGPMKDEFIPAEYIYVPADQLKGNMIVLALEPKSMLGLVTYQQFQFMLKAGQTYPILRVMKK